MTEGLVSPTEGMLALSGEMRAAIGEVFSNKTMSLRVDEPHRRHERNVFEQIIS